MKPVKLGIIGCGIAARKLHWPALQRLQDEFEITAVCNHTEPKARSFAKLVGGVPYFLEYRELLANADVEAVDIILPIHLNYEVTTAALKSGKHVILEKPLAANMRQAKKMLALDRSYPQLKLLAENFRYRALFNRARQMIEEGKIGLPYGVVWNIFHHVDARYSAYAQTEWRLHHRYPGGFVTDGGVHHIAALRLLFGDIRSGWTVTKSVNPQIGEIDTMMLHFETNHNVIGELIFFYSAVGHSDDVMHVLGNTGSMIVRNGEITLKQDGFKEHLEKIDDDGGFYGELKNFYEAVREGKSVKSTFSEGYKDLEVILAAIRAAQSGRRFITRHQK